MQSGNQTIRASGNHLQHAEEVARVERVVRLRGDGLELRLDCLEELDRRLHQRLAARDQLAVRLEQVAHLQSGQSGRSGQSVQSVQSVQSGTIASKMSRIESSLAIRQSGNRAIGQSGNRAIGQSGNRAIRQSANRAPSR
eukprot:6065034-Prymnesium_polylepis.1